MKNITLDNFNQKRAMRGADAAQFKIEYEGYECDYLWMSVSDIKKNIKLYPEFAEELKKGLTAYGDKNVAL